MPENSIAAGTDLTDVAFIVCTALHRVGNRAILTGGSAATVYAADAYQSADLDFVLEFAATEGSGAALANLGYSVRGSSYVHESNPFTIDPLGTT